MTENIQLSAKVLQEMIDEHRQSTQKFARRTDEIAGETPDDVVYRLKNELFDTLSEPLKKAQADYLAKANKFCFKEKHMADDVPNQEQV